MRNTSTIKEESFLWRFLGIAHFLDLGNELRTASTLAIPSGSRYQVLLAILVASSPLALLPLGKELFSPDLPFAMFVTGILTITAIILRKKFRIPYQKVANWRRAFRLTHTAFALGCVPAVILVALHPTMFAERHELLNQNSGQVVQVLTIPIFLRIGASIIGAAMWAAVTEEFIYRGLLVSVLRRWQIFSSQHYRDLFAIVVSALLFGAAHMMTWGPFAALAMVGIGLGFALAYIANGEQLMPCILYHFLFDVFSMSLAIYLHFILH